VLITQNALHKIAGSEVNTLELATFFTDQGATVTVYTLFASSPMLDYFKKKNITVTTEDGSIHAKDFDLIWVHQQILPKIFGRELSQQKKLPIIIFYYMSSSVNIELPYTRGLEERLASKIFFVSPEAKDDHLKYRADSSLSYEIFPNPSPKSFIESQFQPTENSIVKNILIVSNHPPQELDQASDLLEHQGIKVTYRGESQKGTATLITPQELLEYDCVISIGKTVQYCLSLGLPIYVYDHFGGPGYLTKETFDKARYHNFAGRGFPKKTPQAIVSEIVDHYQQALHYQQSNRRKFIEQFSIQRVFEATTNDLKPPSSISLDEGYILYLELMHSLIAESIVNQNRAIQLLDIKNHEYLSHIAEINSLRARIADNDKALIELQNQVKEKDRLLSKRGVKAALRLHNITKSPRW